MQLTPWVYTGREGFALRGWHTPPTGKPLLHFIHGNGFCGRAYEPLLRPLAQDFDLWLSDVQGHGDSDPGGRFVGWNRSAELAVEALTAHLAPYQHVPCFAVGHSFGGVLSCLAVAHNPGLFERAVVLDPVILQPHVLMAAQMTLWTGLANHSELARKARARRRHWPDRDSARASLHNRGVYKGWADESLQAFIDHALRDSPEGGVELKCSPDREAEVFSSVAQGLWTALNRIDIPIQVIRAEHTFPFIAASTQQWKSMNQNVSDVVVPGGHCFMQETPNQTAQMVKRYLMTQFQGMV
ncbi:MAG: alpha/beta hydrolase [Rubrivivax sp.]|nr:MAG: alpha/beta hydrolase [Rubrivivax sp.]